MTASLVVQPAQPEVAVRHKRAHAECLGQGEGLLEVGFSLLGSGRVGVGLDDAKLVQRARLVPACLEMPGQVEGLVRMLPGLITVSRETTDFAEPCDPMSITEQRASADTFADPL